MKLKYTGKLGYLEAMYRLNLGDRKKILERIEEFKKSGDKVSQSEKKETESSIIEFAEKLFN